MKQQENLAYSSGNDCEFHEMGTTRGLNCIIVTSVLLLLSLVLGCGRKDNTIKIGLINPETGAFAFYVESIRRGIEIAEEEIEANNLLNGRNLEVLKKDSRGRSEESLTAVHELVEIDEVKYIIGEITSDATMAVLPYTESKGVFLFSPGAASLELTNASELFARNWPSNSAEAIATAEYLYNKLGYKTAIIVCVNLECSAVLQESFEIKFKTLGGDIVDKVVYSCENAEFSSIVSKIKNVEADMIYFAGIPRDIGDFMRQLRETKSTIPVISNSSILESELDGEVYDGIIVPTFAFNPDSPTSEKMKSFVDRYYEKYNSKPTLADACGYDALLLIVEAINKVGDNPEEVAKYIRNLKNYEAAGGLENFENGDVLMELSFKIIKDGIANDINM